MTFSNRRARDTPDKLAIVDGRVRLRYGEYYRRAERLAAHFVGLGLGADDVVAIQLPNWSEFAVAVNAAMLAGIPFCQFHSDFRSREVEFILSFTDASALIVPSRFRRFDYLAMLAGLRPKVPQLRHVMVVGDDVPAEYFDVRSFLDAPGEPAIDRETAAPTTAARQRLSAHRLHLRHYRRSEGRAASAQHDQLCSALRQ